MLLTGYRPPMTHATPDQPLLDGGIDVVVPTVGRASLSLLPERLVAEASPAIAGITLVDDRRHSDVEAAHAAGAIGVLVPNDRTRPGEVTGSPLVMPDLLAAVTLLALTPVPGAAR